MTDCGVCIGGGFEGSVDNYYSREISSRRVWRCHECQRKIAVGEKHVQRGGEYEDGWENWRFCSLCAEIGEVFSCGESMTFGLLWDDMQEYVFPELTTSNKCFVKLSAAAKAEVMRRWNEWKFSV